MANVRVGVQHTENGFEVRQHWVEINGKRIDADEGLREVAYGVTKPGEFGIVTITLFSSSFTTTPWENPPKEHGFTEEQKREFVRTAEADLQNVWDQSLSVPVIARTIVYGLLDKVWGAAQSC